ncbi:MAG: hypothetical protein QG673_545 [Pseudomonadota bacterium]|nr:hypothetical protein [Pseudomonadota bacterium]
MQSNFDKNTLGAKVFAKGTIKLPAILRHQLRIHDGDQILFIKKGSAWVLTTHHQNIIDTQEYIKSLKQPSSDNFSLVDELIQERRDEAKKASNK